MTNVDEQFNLLIDLGQHPKKKADTVTVLEKIGHFLDEENEALFQKYKRLRLRKSRRSLQHDIYESGCAKHIDVDRPTTSTVDTLCAASSAMATPLCLRDPNGIRPAFWYHDDEVVVVASERPVIQTAFNLRVDQVQEITPGHALIVKQDGKISMDMIRTPGEKLSCSFERIYFSRGSDKDIYEERKALGDW